MPPHNTYVKLSSWTSDNPGYASQLAPEQDGGQIFIVEGSSDRPLMPPPFAAEDPKEPPEFHLPPSNHSYYHQHHAPYYPHRPRTPTFRRPPPTRTPEEEKLERRLQASKKWAGKRKSRSERPQSEASHSVPQEEQQHEAEMQVDEQQYAPPYRSRTQPHHHRHQHHHHHSPSPYHHPRPHHPEPVFYTPVHHASPPPVNNLTSWEEEARQRMMALQYDTREEDFDEKLAMWTGLPPLNNGALERRERGTSPAA